MRCKNCGWPNKPNVTTCVKCNSPLTSDDADAGYSVQPQQAESSAPLNATVREEDVFGARNQGGSSGFQPQGAQQPETSVCPKCGYPVRAGSDKCPNCKFQLGGQSGYAAREEYRRPDPVQEPARRPTRMASADGAQPKFRGTINPYMMNMAAEPSFVLKPLKRMEERHDFDEQEYEGKEVVLNRDNTEPGNPSITSRQQAVISNEDGHWYIEDKSDQKTTFVQAAGKIELHDGDIILLGNRLFEFKK